MTAARFKPLINGIGLQLELRTPQENKKFREMRDRLAELLQLRSPKHETYMLHLSVAYLLRHLNESQKTELTAMLVKHFEEMPKEFELAAPEFCRFKDMFAFERLFYLKDQGK